MNKPSKIEAIIDNDSVTGPLWKKCHPQVRDTIKHVWSVTIQQTDLKNVEKIVIADDLLGKFIFSTPAKAWHAAGDFKGIDICKLLNEIKDVI